MTQDELKLHFHYNPDSGMFLRLGFINRWGTFVKREFSKHKLNSEGYLVFSINGKRYKAHRLVFLYMDGILLEDDVEIDHIDGNRSNNAYKNLRIVKRAQNMKNKALYASNTTGCIGVSKYGERFRARINVDGVRISLGLFDTLDEASMVRKRYEEKYNYSNSHGRIVDESEA